MKVKTNRFINQNVLLVNSLVQYNISIFRHLRNIKFDWIFLIIGSVPYACACISYIANVMTLGHSSSTQSTNILNNSNCLIPMLMPFSIPKIYNLLSKFLIKTLPYEYIISRYCSVLVKFIAIQGLNCSS